MQSKAEQNQKTDQKNIAFFLPQASLPSARSVAAAIAAASSAALSPSA